MMKTIGFSPKLFLIIAIVSPTLCWVNFPPIASAYSDSLALVCWGLVAGTVLATALSVRTLHDAAWREFYRPALLIFMLLCINIAWQIKRGDYGFFGDIISFIYAIAAALTISSIGLIASIEKEYRTKFTEAIAYSLVIAMCFNSFVGWAQYLDIQTLYPYVNPLSEPGRIFGNFRQPNHYALYTWWGAIAVIWLRTSGKISNLTYLFLIFAATSALTLSGSRTVRIFFFVAIFSTLLLNHTHRKQTFQATGIALAFYIFSFFAGTVASKTSNLQLFGYERMAEGDATGERLQLWLNAVQIIPSIPFSGCGIRQFNFCWTHLSPPAWVHGTVSNAHNLLLNSVIELGWATTLAISLWIIYTFLRSSTISSRDINWFLYSNIFLAGMIAAMLEYPMSYMYLLIPVALSLGCLQGMAAGKRSLATISPHGLSASLLGRRLITPLLVTAPFVIGGWSYGSQYATVARLFSGDPNKPYIEDVAKEAWLFTPVLQFAMTLWVSEDMSEKNAKQLLPFFASAGRSTLSPGFLARYALVSASAGEQNMARHLAWRAISMDPKILDGELAPHNLPPSLHELSEYLKSPYPVTAPIEVFKITAARE
jgi:hypothetical protein